jgi:hypothetical protein
MELFSLSEEKALLFHRAIVGLVHEHPNLLVRARAELENQRARTPEQENLWDRWAALLDKPLDDLSAVILADTPDGGLLRAHSPLGAALDTSERNAVWRRIGLIQFFHHYLIAVDDLGVSTPEQAAITGRARSGPLAQHRTGADVEAGAATTEAGRRPAQIPGRAQRQRRCTAALAAQHQRNPGSRTHGPAHGG